MAAPADSMIPFLRAALVPPHTAGEVEKHVLAALQLAKFRSSETFRERQKDLADFYDDNFVDHMTTLVSQIYARAKDRINHNLKGHRYLAVVKMMTDTLAVIFHQPPETWLEQDGARLDEAHPEVQQWRRDQKTVRFGTTLKTLDRVRVLHKTALLEVKWVRDELRWEIVRPHRVRLNQDLADPTDIRYAPSVHVELPQPIDSFGATPPVLWESWLRTPDGRWLMFLHDEAGRPYDNPLFPRTQFVDGNPYGLHPFTVWRDGEPRDGSFFVSERDSWWSEQRWVNTSVIDIARTLRVQAFGIPFLKNWASEDQAPTIAPDEPIISNHRDADFTFVAPKTNLPELEAGLDNALRRHAVAENLPAETWSGAGATRNLGALQMLRLPLEERRKDGLEPSAHALDRTFEITKIVGNHHRARGATWRAPYSPNTRLGVAFAELPEVTDAQQETLVLAFEYAAGLSTPVDTIMSRRKCSRERALEIWRTNREMNQDLTVSTSVAAPAPKTPPSQQQDETR